MSDQKDTHTQLSEKDYHNVKYSSAEPVTYKGGRAVRYIHKDGWESIRVGGQPAFQNNNPGNVGYSPFSKEHGAIGKDPSGFAIFPNWATGEKAAYSLLKYGVYKNMSIRHAIEKYAPPKHNHTEAYIKYVVQKSGLSEDKVISSMTDGEFDHVRNAMKQFEDSTPGYDLISNGSPGQEKWYRADFTPPNPKSLKSPKISPTGG